MKADVNVTSNLHQLVRQLGAAARAKIVPVSRKAAKTFPFHQLACRNSSTLRLTLHANAVLAWRDKLRCGEITGWRQLVEGLPVALIEDHGIGPRLEVNF